MTIAGSSIFFFAVLDSVKEPCTVYIKFLALAGSSVNSYLGGNKPKDANCVNFTKTGPLRTLFLTDQASSPEFIHHTPMKIIPTSSRFSMVKTSEIIGGLVGK